MKGFLTAGALSVTAAGLVFVAGNSKKPLPSCAPEVLRCGDISVSAMRCGKKTLVFDSVFAIPDMQLRSCLADAGAIPLDGGHL